MDNRGNNVLMDLAKPGPRLPWITDWLTSQVWSVSRYKDMSPDIYLTKGEQEIHNFEELIAIAANRFYDELSSAASQVKPLTDTIAENTAVVVFDGASLREVPLFIHKAEETGFRIVNSSTSFAALPSTTTAFVDQRLLGKPVAPKTLPQRKELKDQGIKAYYFDDAISTHQTQCPNGEKVLIWSAFPDVTYQDSDARFARHFADMQKLYDAAWKNTVMQVPRTKRIVVTSDHGYIFFGASFDSTRPSDVCDLLEQDRQRVFAEKEPLPDPANHPQLQVLPDRRLAMVRGRIKNKPRGPSANRIYRHGGMSLMEMLVPWLVIERE
jgi:hypothetical protein